MKEILYLVIEQLYSCCELEEQQILVECLDMLDLYEGTYFEHQLFVAKLIAWCKLFPDLDELFIRMARYFYTFYRGK